MRHVLTSLLTLKWAIAFALEAFVCIAGAARAVGGIHFAVAAQIVALLASYLAIVAERGLALDRQLPQGSMLGRISGRGRAVRGGA